MEIPLVTLALIGFWLFAGHVPVASDAIAQADAEGLAELRSTYLNAYAAGDNGAMASLYMLDAVRMPYDSPAQQGRAAILDAYERTFASRRFRPDLEFTVDDLLVRGDLAIERGRYREELHPLDGGAALLELGKYVAVARKDVDGEWRYQTTIFNRDGPPTPLRAAAPESRKAGEAPSSHLERARELRRLLETGNHEAARAYMADDPRRWWESREGEGAPWIVGAQQTWAAWDRHFRSRKDVLKWAQSGNRATVLVRETNDYYELLEREPALNEAVYYFDAQGKIEGLLIRAAGERSLGRTGEFLAWAKRNAPDELELLMPGGEIDPSRPERFRRLLNRWRIDAGLDAIVRNAGAGP